MKNKERTSLLRANVFLHLYSVLVPILTKHLFSDAAESALKHYKTGSVSWLGYLKEAFLQRPVIALPLAWLFILIGSIFLDVYLMRKKQPLAKTMLYLLPLAPVLLAASTWLFLLYLPVRPA